MSVVVGCSGEADHAGEDLGSVQQAVVNCSVPNVSGQAGIDPAVASGYITAITANGTSTLVVTYSPSAAPPFNTNVNIGHTTATGSWSGTRITSINVSGTNVLQVNGVNSITFVGGVGPVSSVTWAGATGGVTRIGYHPSQSDGQRRILYFEGINNGVPKSASKTLTTTCSPSVTYGYDSNNDYVLSATATDASVVDFLWDGVSIGTDSSAPFTKTKADGNWHLYSIKATYPGNGYVTTSSPYHAVKPQVASGYATNCMTYTGKLYCWGYGSYGAVGNGGTTNVGTPTQIWPNTFKEVEKVAMHRYGGCALQAGNVFCWGRNLNGILGVDPAVTPQSTSPLWTIFSGDVYDLSVGDSHACVLKGAPGDGDGYCWGKGSNGQMGVGTTTATNYTLQGPFSWFSDRIYSGGDTNCLREGGTLYCWGRDDWGQVGNGTGTSSAVTSPVNNGIVDAVDVAVGYRHACALRSGGSVSCWGHNEYAQLGIGSADSLVHTPPVTATSWASGLSSLYSGRNYNTCGIFSTGGIKCIGENAYAQIGNNTTSAYVTTPTAPTGLTSGVLSGGIGSWNGIAFKGGHAYVWGDNTHTQIGDPSFVGALAMEPRLLPGF